MHLIIDVQADDPPAGMVTRTPDDGNAPRSIEFIGWLGMLRALDDLLTDAP